jgi:septal ring factor EnvC (AmiA/AmiB activator)
MRHLSKLALLAAVIAAPAFAQNNLIASAAAPAATATAAPADASTASVDYAALREQVAKQNKTLTDQVAAQRAILKKNQDLFKEAQKIQAANLKLADEKKKLEAQNADLEKQREALKSIQKPVEGTN